MDKGSKRARLLRILLPLSVGAAVLFTLIDGSFAEESEIDAFQRAITSQSKADALAFMRDFGSSHLAPDLIELLRAGVALEVCSSLSDASSQTTSACNKLQSGVATVPMGESSAQARLPAQ